MKRKNIVLSMLFLIVSFFPCFAHSITYHEPKEVPKNGQFFMYVEVNPSRPAHLRQTIIISHFRKKFHSKDIKKNGWYSLTMKDLPKVFKFNIPIIYFP